MRPNAGGRVMSWLLYILGCVTAHIANRATSVSTRINLHQATNAMLVIVWPVVASYILFDAVWNTVANWDNRG